MAQSYIDPFRQKVVVCAMNHVWKKKQDVKKHKTQDLITCVQVENPHLF